MKIIWLLIYYLIGIYLPSSSFSLVGVRIRAYLVSKIFAYVGSNVNIGQGVYFGRGSLISIGNSSGIGEKSRLVAMDKITIGDDVMIAPEVLVLTGGHDYNDPQLLLREQVSTIAPVNIGDDCWIGARAIILPGVSITNRVIIGAGSVVTKSINESGIYAGNPAKKIKGLDGGV
ncbi:acyltransferase [Vibrio tubiashii]|uniref:Acyltransferase n=1 Tax=Vibrio tubiashii TaxID=29498 RepID=A0AAE5GSR5_9VIBR|nr:acyltransferase [Vibrio tubiashii]NOI82325.1 acyltransferase [Vibrio tubiashii]